MSQNDHYQVKPFRPARPQILHVQRQHPLFRFLRLQVPINQPINCRRCSHGARAGFLTACFVSSLFLSSQLKNFATTRACSEQIESTFAIILISTPPSNLKYANFTTDYDPSRRWNDEDPCPLASIHAAAHVCVQYAELCSPPSRSHTISSRWIITRSIVFNHPRLFRVQYLSGILVLVLPSCIFQRARAVEDDTRREAAHILETSFCCQSCR